MGVRLWSWRGEGAVADNEERCLRVLGARRFVKASLLEQRFNLKYYLCYGRVRLGFSSRGRVLLTLLG